MAFQSELWHRRRAELLPSQLCPPFIVTPSSYSCLNLKNTLQSGHIEVFDGIFIRKTGQVLNLKFSACKVWALSLICCLFWKMASECNWVLTFSYILWWPVSENYMGWLKPGIGSRMTVRSELQRMNPKLRIHQLKSVELQLVLIDLSIIDFVFIGSVLSITTSGSNPMSWHAMAGKTIRKQNYSRFSSMV